MKTLKQIIREVRVIKDGRPQKSVGQYSIAGRSPDNDRSKEDGHTRKLQGINDLIKKHRQARKYANDPKASRIQKAWADFQLSKAKLVKKDDETK